MSDIQASVSEELDRIQEDAEMSFKGHYNAGDWWEIINLWIGTPTAIVTTIAGGFAYNEYSFVSGSLAILAAAAIALMTFLNPSDRAQKHKSAAGYYHTLRNQVRIFQKIELPNLKDSEAIQKRVLEFAKLRDQLNNLSLTIPRWAYEIAKKDSDEGRTIYRTDKENSL